MDSHFDVDVFISDIEERPAIWDLWSELYSDRGKRTEAWEELCLKYNPNFSEKSEMEKNKIAAQLQRKWKSFRDCFKREHAKQSNTKSGSALSRRRPYIYYRQLSFLLNVADTRRGRSAEKNDERDAVKRKRAKKKKTIDEENMVETAILHNISEQLQSHKSNNNEEDSDRNFALSLVPHFKQMPYEFKLDAQSDILMVLKKYKQYMRIPQNQHHEYFTPSSREPRSYHILKTSTSGYQSPYQNEFTQKSPSPVSDPINSGRSDDSNSTE